PGQLNYGSSGNGAIDHLGAFLINREFGIDAQHVPYKGNDIAMQDLAVGRIHYLLSGLLTHSALRDGRLRALGVTSVKRNPVLPNVPTFHETIMPNFDISTWQGLLAPAKTPAAIIARLNEEVNRTIASPEYRDKLESMGAEVVGGTAEEWGKYYRGEYARWTKIVKDAGVTP
ncbi:MAG: tripartite tricarboxylate transporter substrate-binding protein, partial [Gallionella sp.]|nr:tripartite tricarboxylate transporter substrate-binding protein [Gallionella sp.]